MECHVGKLFAVLRGLAYKRQYKVCYDFYDEIIKYPQYDENKHCLKFDEIYESINTDWLEEDKDKIQQCVEVMLKALRDIEMSEPAIFNEIVAKIIQMLIEVYDLDIYNYSSAAVGS